MPVGWSKENLRPGKSIQHLTENIALPKGQHFLDALSYSPKSTALKMREIFIKIEESFCLK